MNRFLAYELALEIARRLAAVLPHLKANDPDLADQAYRACKSIGLAVAEGGRRGGKDRSYHFRIAAGSAQELLMALELAATFGHLDGGTVEPLRKVIDRELGLLWGLTRPR